MASRVLQRLARVAAAVVGVSVVLASSAAARPTVPRTARSSRGFNLFAGSTNVVMNVNHVQCNINIGESCVDPTNSPVLGGGRPKGSPDQYIFNAGLQIAAIIPATRRRRSTGPATPSARSSSIRAVTRRRRGPHVDVQLASHRRPATGRPPFANDSLYAVAIGARTCRSRTCGRGSGTATSACRGRPRPDGHPGRVPRPAWNFDR
jgi:hypothetical protein